MSQGTHIIRGNSREQLLLKIKEVKEQLGRTPKKSEFIGICGTSGFYHRIREEFGSWVEALKLIGLKPPKRKRKGLPRIEKVYDRKKVLAQLKEFYKVNKKVPTIMDIHRGLLPPERVFIRLFGSLPKARLLAGIKGQPTRYGLLSNN